MPANEEFSTEVWQYRQSMPLPATLEMWRALKSNGVPTALWVAPGEGHQWGQLRHMMFKANKELEWFERYAMGRAYTPEKLP